MFSDRRSFHLAGCNLELSSLEQIWRLLRRVEKESRRLYI